MSIGIYDINSYFRCIKCDTGVTHTAGEDTVILTLISTLDQINDIGMDAVSVFDNASVYDKGGDPIERGQVIILEDTNAPSVSGQNPANGATGVFMNNPLRFTLADTGSGIDWSTFEIQLSGSKGYSHTYTSASPEVSKTGWSAAYNVTVEPDTFFESYEVITVTVNADDLSGNSLVPPTWSFTTGSLAVLSHILTLHPSGDSPLDSNDGDSSWIGTCCTHGGQTWHIDMDDDPVGIGSATINSITVYAYAKYIDDPDPWPIQFAGSMAIGYKTGIDTAWDERITASSGGYGLIASDTYTTDSDGGSLDISDINNLQVAFRRNISGPAQLRVTEVYAEINYTTIEAPSSPDTPTNISPANNAPDVSLTPTLISSDFFDPNIGDTHQASQWQITTTPGDYSSPVYESGITSDLTAHTVSAGTPLNESTTYYWHVRHRDSRGFWSDYSTETSFNTGAQMGLVTLHPSGVVPSNWRCSAVGGSWADVLDTNDGNSSIVDCTATATYAWTMGSYYYYDYQANFSVTMDPAGLAGANIQSVTIYAWVDAFIDWQGSGNDPIPVFQICFEGTAHCSIANFSNGYVEVTVDHPDPSLLDLENLQIDVVTQVVDIGGAGRVNAGITFYTTEIGVDIVYSY